MNIGKHLFRVRQLPAYPVREQQHVMLQDRINQDVQHNILLLTLGEEWTFRLEISEACAQLFMHKETCVPGKRGYEVCYVA